MVTDSYSLAKRAHAFFFSLRFCTLSRGVDAAVFRAQVLVLLFLLMTACPNSVFLNRGNHEDFGLCCVYGFQKECLAKYNDVVFR